MKKIIALGLMLAMLVSLPVFGQSPFGPLLYEQGVIVGTGNGLNPEGSITRSEMVAILATLDADGFKAFEVPLQGTFKDVPPSHWAYAAVEYAYANGFTAGKGNGEFGPSDTLNYNQAVLFFASRLGLDLTGVAYETASVQLSERYEFGLKKSVPGDDTLSRDQVFELLAQGLYMVAIDAKQLFEFLGIPTDEIDAYIDAYLIAKEQWYMD